MRYWMIIPLLKFILFETILPSIQMLIYIDFSWYFSPETTKRNVTWIRRILS